MRPTFNLSEKDKNSGSELSDPLFHGMKIFVCVFNKDSQLVYPGIGKGNALSDFKSLVFFIKSSLLAAFLIFYLVSNSFSQAKSESRNYEIVVLGMKIGNMVAKRVNKSDSLLYQVDSQVKFWFFGSVELKYKTIAHFLGGKLVKARSDSKTNRGDFASKIDWNGKSYSVNAISYEYENDKPLKGPLAWCGTKMFFHEPTDKELFLSEVYGVSGPIKKIENGVYELELDGKRNRYYYKSGVLEKIIVENPIKDYQVRLVK